MTTRIRYKEGTYYAKNRARILSRLSTKRRKVNTRAASSGKLWKQLSKQPWFNAVRRAHKRAKKRRKSFDLDYVWAAKVWTGRCELTGIKFTKASRSAGLYSASIDRKDNSLGYTQTNCRFVINAVNMMKSTGTDTDVRRIARALLRKQPRRR